MVNIALDCGCYCYFCWLLSAQVDYKGQDGDEKARGTIRQAALLTIAFEDATSASTRGASRILVKIGGRTTFVYIIS